MESSLLALLCGGLAIAVAAWIWLLVRAFEESVWWGLGSLVLPPVALLFSLRHAQRAIVPLVVFILGGVVAAAPAFYSLVEPVDLGLREGLSQGSRLWRLAWAVLRGDAAHEWMVSRAFYLQAGGVAVAVSAWIWLLARAFRQQWAWGLGSLFVPPVGLAFAARHPRKGSVPVTLLAIALLVAAVPAAYILFVPLDLGPREKMVDGQRHLTLTGWDRKDYSLLKLKSDVSVLQMANPDVTDQSLEALKDMKDLRELDLNDTQVTDAGLGILLELPALATLRLARTKVTDRGFYDALSPKDSLMQLDLRGTRVSREALKAWREAKPGRRASQ